MNRGGHERPAAIGTPQDASHDPESEYLGSMSDSSHDMFAFGGHVVPLYRSRHSLVDGHDTCHILSDDSIEQLL
jgi:hypothetical protein